MSYDITIPAPEVPYPGGTSHADFIRKAARNIDAGFEIGGSNVTRTVINLLKAVADAMDEQKPRIPEPGHWGVVEAAVDRGGYVWQWVHHPKNAWLNAEGESATWSALVDPTLVRPGIEDAS